MKIKNLIEREVEIAVCNALSLSRKLKRTKDSNSRKKCKKMMNEKLHKFIKHIK